MMMQMLRNVFGFVVNIPNFAMLYLRLMLDREVPVFGRAILWGALIYVVSPIDLIPGALLPVIGWLEDMLILYVALKVFVRVCPPHILDRHVATVAYLDRMRNRWRM